VTVAVRLVVSVVCAVPLESVLTTLAENDPAVVVKVTGTDDSTLPLGSLTDAVIADVPPLAATFAGFALTEMRPTAAAPMPILIAPAVPVVAPPEDAVIVAVPDDPPEENIAVARPLISVSVSEGSMLPSVVVNVICVPEWGGVPAGSSTCAETTTLPLIGRLVAEVVRVIVDPEGASKGTRWQALATDTQRASAIRTGNRTHVII
jgi:hypothetical protein